MNICYFGAYFYPLTVKMLALSKIYYYQCWITSFLNLYSIYYVRKMSRGLILQIEWDVKLEKFVVTKIKGARKVEEEVDKENFVFDIEKKDERAIYMNKETQERYLTV